MTLARLGDAHVLPVNDLREHEETRTCWCRPTLQSALYIEDPNYRVIVVHNSADGRELVEQHGVN